MRQTFEGGLVSHHPLSTFVLGIHKLQGVNPSISGGRCITPCAALCSRSGERYQRVVTAPTAAGVGSGFSRRTATRGPVPRPVAGAARGRTGPPETP